MMRHKRLLLAFTGIVLLIWGAIVFAESGLPGKPNEKVSAGRGESPGSIQSGSGIPERMVLIPEGEFLMGTPSDEGDSDEHPQHKVYLDAFYIDKYEVTNSEYEKFDPSHKRRTCSEGDHDPVIGIIWGYTIKYCNWRSKEEGLEPCYNEKTGECDFTKNGYRLPTEAEWEKSARGTDGRKYPWGNTKPDGSQCNLADKNASLGGSDESTDDGYQYTSPVGSYESGQSPYGLYDMAGNVWEWCHDWYDENYYNRSPYKNPKGPDAGNLRVIRGGSWNYDSPYVRAGKRLGFRPGCMSNYIGFRCARTP